MHLKDKENHSCSGLDFDRRYIASVKIATLLQSMENLSDFNTRTFTFVINFLHVLFLFCAFSESSDHQSRTLKIKIWKYHAMKSEHVL